MKMLLVAALIATAAFAQDYPLHAERPKPSVAVLVGVCEKRQETLMVAIFTYSNGKTLVVDGQHMQGFQNADDIVRYAATADSIVERAQTCGDAQT